MQMRGIWNATLEPRLSDKCSRNIEYVYLEPSIVGLRWQIKGNIVSKQKHAIEVK